MPKRADMTELRNAARKPPKKVTEKRRIGTLNVKTGRFSPRFPDVLVLPVRVYDELYRVAQWLEATPPSMKRHFNFELVEVDDWIALRVDKYVRLWAAGARSTYAASVQIETKKTRTRNTEPGDLVALLEDNTSIEQGETEHYCVLTRGKHGYDYL